jgi:hypothetical protein
MQGLRRALDWLLTHAIWDPEPELTERQQIMLSIRTGKTAGVGKEEWRGGMGVVP